MRAPARYWDGSVWQPLGPQGPPGPPGPLAAPTAPTGAAGGVLTGSYPNPGIDRQQVGGLLAVQRIFGANNAYKTIVNGQNYTTNAAGTIPLSIAYTPPVSCAWEVEVHVSIQQKTDAAYHSAFTRIVLSPEDDDALGDQSWLNQTQHSTVQTYTFKQIVRTFMLRADIAYTATAQFTQLATVGTWQFHQNPSYLAMIGRAWAL